MTKQKILQERKGKCGKWQFRRMLAAWPSLAGERVLMGNGDGRGSSDAGSGYVVGFRVRVVAQGRCGVSPTTSPRHSARGELAPKGPFQPQPVCAPWSLVRRWDHGENDDLHFRREPRGLFQQRLS